MNNKGTTGTTLLSASRARRKDPRRKVMCLAAATTGAAPKDKLSLIVTKKLAVRVDSEWGPRLRHGPKLPVRTAELALKFDQGGPDMPETLEFKAELKQLLHLITHSLYSNQEIFLRELISNASDAINKIRFDSLQHEELLEGNKDWKIQIKADRSAGTLTVSDNGIGLSREAAVENL